MDTPRIPILFQSAILNEYVDDEVCPHRLFFSPTDTVGWPHCTSPLLLQPPSSWKDLHCSSPSFRRRATAMHAPVLALATKRCDSLVHVFVHLLIHLLVCWVRDSFIIGLLVY